jgi:hypothetical protein
VVLPTVLGKTSARLSRFGHNQPDDSLRLVVTKEERVCLRNTGIMLVRHENHQTVWATAPEKIDQTSVDGKRLDVAAQEDSTSTHFDLEPGLYGSGHGDDIETAFPEG